MIGTTEIIIIVAAAVFLFGGKKVVDWARSIGKAKRAYEEESEDKPAPAKRKPAKKATKKPAKKAKKTKK